MKYSNEIMYSSITTEISKKMLLNFWGNKNCNIFAPHNTTPMKYCKLNIFESSCYYEIYT